MEASMTQQAIQLFISTFGP